MTRTREKPQFASAVTLRPRKLLLLATYQMFAAAAFCGAPAAGVANENSPHHLSGQREKPGRVLPVRFALIDKSKVNLVD